MSITNLEGAKVLGNPSFLQLTEDEFNQRIQAAAKAALEERDEEGDIFKKTLALLDEGNSASALMYLKKYPVILKESLLEILEISVKKKLITVIDFCKAQKLKLAPEKLARNFGNAVENGSCLGMRTFLTFGADPSLPDSLGKIPIHRIFDGMSVYRQDGILLAMLKIFVEYNANLNACDKEGRTILHRGVGLKPEVFNYLLDSGADFTLADNEGRTPLHYAVTWNTNCSINIETAEKITKNTLALLDRNVNIRAFNKYGDCPFDLLHFNSSESVLLRFIEEGMTLSDFNEKLLKAFLIKNEYFEFDPVGNGEMRTRTEEYLNGERVNVLHKLIDMGLSTDYTIEGKTLLHWVGPKTDLEIIRVLIANGADKTIRYNGRTPAEYYKNKYAFWWPNNNDNARLNLLRVKGKLNLSKSC